MRTVIAIVSAFMLGALVPVSPVDNAQAVLSEDLPEHCNGAPAVAVVDGEGGSQVAFYQGPIDDTVYVSWTLNSNGALVQTAPYKHAIGIYVYGSGDLPAEIFKGPGGGGAQGYCEDAGERHDFYFSIFGGVVGKTVGGSCSVSFSYSAGAQIGITANIPSGSVLMEWAVTLQCEANVLLESATLLDLGEGYYHCPVGSTCILNVDAT